MTLHTTIIAKSPVPGRVKTRLCPPCTLERAAELATAATIDTIEAIDAIPGIESTRRALLLDGDVQAWMPAEYAVVAQRGEGLGERLCNGFRDLGPGVIIGMETPHVAHLLSDALDHVRCDRNVIGLAEDGGYWMIGLGQAALDCIDDMFDGIPMSTASTGALQLQRLRELGGRVSVLRTARDLDTFDDLVAIANSGRSGRLAALARETVSALSLPTRSQR
jgi:glycosyltransferase A (GT-A) superfamily protein (DUF2064 family)